MTDADVVAACLVVVSVFGPLGLAVHLTDRLLERWLPPLVNPRDRSWYVAVTLSASLVLAGGGVACFH